MYPFVLAVSLNMLHPHLATARIYPPVKQSTGCLCFHFMAQGKATRTHPNSALNLLSQLILTPTLAHERAISSLLKASQGPCLRHTSCRGFIIFAGLLLSLLLSWAEVKSSVREDALPSAFRAFSPDDPCPSFFARVAVAIQVSTLSSLDPFVFKLLVRAVG